MDYILADRILPAYYRTNYGGGYKPLYGRFHCLLSRQPISALHYHSCAEIGICLRGCGEIWIENRIYRFSAGDMQFVPPGVPHFAASSPDTETYWHWISVEPLRILGEAGFQDMTQLRELSGKSFAGVFQPREHPELADLCLKLQDRLLQEKPYLEEELVFLAGQLLVETARAAGETGEESGSRGYGGKLQPAIRYIRENYADKDAMREEQIAGVCGMSTSHFRAVFKGETGMSVRDFILHTRLAGAAYLLRSTDKSVLQIALESGFGQASCFNRMFLRHFGVTPTAFRKATKQK